LRCHEISNITQCIAVCGHFREAWSLDCDVTIIEKRYTEGTSESFLGKSDEHGEKILESAHLWYHPMMEDGAASQRGVQWRWTPERGADNEYCVHITADFDQRFASTGRCYIRSAVNPSCIRNDLYTFSNPYTLSNLCPVL